MTHHSGDRFQIISPLGVGGMGAVYRVTDSQRAGEEVALKLIRRAKIGSAGTTGSGKSEAELRLRFKEEFRAMARLKHPNTIAVYDYGRFDDDANFLTMEVVPGEELAEAIARGPMPLDQVYPLLIQLLQALEFIHSRLFVHRDIKSQNIRIRPDGVLKLMDFGLMTQLGIRTHGGVLTGTPGYVSPEMVRGGVVDGRSDLYAVGCLAYEMLTGRLPFVGRVIEVIRAHATEAPRPLHQLRGQLPLRLEAIVMRLLEKEPAKRYAHAGEVITDLAHLAGIAIARQNIEQKRSYLVTGALVGREAEMATLNAALDAARAGRGQSIFISAPAGAGKSRLVGEFALQAKTDAVYVLEGQGRQSGLAPYELLAAALRPLLTITPAAGVARWGPVLMRLFPDLAPLGVSPAPALDHELERGRLNETVAAWLAEISQTTPLVWVLENLQWADPHSIETINHCIRQGGATRVLFLATLRGDEVPPGHPIGFTIDEGLTSDLRLDALNFSQIEKLLQVMLHQYDMREEFAKRLFETTGGNPYFLTEVLRYLMEEGILLQREGVWRFPADPSQLEWPVSAEETLLRRLAHLSAGARDIAGVAAVIGRPVDLEMLLALSGLEEDPLFAHIDELIERQIMQREDDCLRFTHDRTRHVLYGQLREVSKRVLHQICGKFIEGRHGPNAPALVTELAYHFSRGSDKHRAFHYLRLAGSQAEEAGAEVTALEFWREADSVLDTLELGPEKTELQLDLWWNIGFASFLLYPHQATEALGRMKNVLEARPELDSDGHRLFGAYNILANAYGFAGMPQEGLAIVDLAVAALPEKNSKLHGAMAVSRCASLIAAGRYDEVSAYAKAAEALLWEAETTEAMPPPVLAARVGALTAQNAICFQGFRPSVPLRDRALAVALAIGDEDPFTVWLFFGIWYAWTGRAEQALEYVRMTNRKCRKIGAPPYLWVLYLRPYLAHQRGEHEEALGLIQQASRYPHLAQNAFPRQLLRVLKGEVLLALGDPGAAREEFSLAERAGRDAGMSLVTIRALLGTSALHLKAGAHELAREAARAALELAAGGPARNPLHEAIAERQLGEIALGAGTPALALAPLEKALAIVEDPAQDNLIEQARIHLALGRMAQLKGEQGRVAQAFASARRLFQSIGDERGLALVEQAEAQPQAPSAAGESSAEGLHLRIRHLTGFNP